MEAEENSIHLKEEDPAAVALLIGWLYRGVIPGTEKYMSPFIKSIFSFSETIQIPISEQGTLYPFTPTQIPVQAILFGGLGSGSGSDCFHHICSQSQYTIFSPEELRLADYKLNRKYQGDVPAATTAPATVVAPPPAPPAPPAQPTQAPGLFSGLGTSSSAAGPSLFPNRSSQVSQDQTTSSSLFGGFGQAPYQPHAGPPSGTFPGLANPATSQSYGGLFAQPNTTQHQNMFARLHNPTLQLSTSGTALPTSRPPNSNIFGGLPPHTNQTSNIFAHLSNSTLDTPSSTLFGPPAPAVGQPQNPFSAATSQAPPIQAPSLFGGTLPTGGLFGGLSQTANPNPNLPTGVNNSNPQDPATSFLSTTTNQSTGGLFGNPPPPQGHQVQNNTFPTMNPNRSHGSNHYGAHYAIYEPNAVLPAGTSMITIRPQKPKNPSEFGYYLSIKHSKSPRSFIEGIPQCDPMDEQFIDLEKQQLALLNLCIMAETQCWPKLFNDAISAYIRGEHKLQRSLTLDFIDRIYSRTYPESTLRAYVLDSISRLKTEGVEDISPYIEMANKHEDFLADLLGKVMGSSAPLKDVTDKTIENYHMYGLDNEDTSYEDEGERGRNADRDEAHIQ